MSIGSTNGIARQIERFRRALSFIFFRHSAPPPLHELFTQFVGMINEDEMNLVVSEVEEELLLREVSEFDRYASAKAPEITMSDEHREGTFPH